MTIYYRKHANGVGGILKYTLYGDDVDELNEWKEDFVNRYKEGYCGKCSDPIPYDEEWVLKEFDKNTVVYHMLAERWTSCD